MTLNSYSLHWVGQCECVVSTDLRDIFSNSFQSSWDSKGLGEVCPHLPVQLVLVRPHAGPLPLLLAPTPCPRSDFLQSSASPVVQLEDKKQEGTVNERDKPDEENKEAESGKDRGEGDENQVTKVFGGRREEKDLQKVGQYQVLHNICQF